MKKNIYMVSLPYPKINIEGKCSKYEKIILQNYAGETSELTSVNQYMYSKIFLFKNYPEIAKTLLGISLVEMNHLNILGNLAFELGADPRYWIKTKSKNKYWNSKFISYEQSPKEIIKENIENEKKTISQYKKSISLISDKNITSILNRIMLDEIFHIKILTKIYNNLL